MTTTFWGDQPRDNKFISLYKKVVQGNIPYYHALIKKDSIKPFSSSFTPTVPSGFDEYVIRTLSAGQAPSIHVYQVGDTFIMSDDYVLFNYYLQIGVTEFPCFCMGEPIGKDVIKKKLIGTPRLPSFETI